MICGAVGGANCIDRDGLPVLCWLNKAKAILPKKIYADLGYRGLEMRTEMQCYGIEIETIGRKNKTTFSVEPKRWIVDRTFAWLRKCRRMSKDYDRITATEVG